MSSYYHYYKEELPSKADKINMPYFLCSSMSLTTFLHVPAWLLVNIERMHFFLSSGFLTSCCRFSRSPIWSFIYSGAFCMEIWYLFHKSCHTYRDETYYVKYYSEIAEYTYLLKKITREKRSRNL